ncbi:sodium- and chloride-dependent GABA transporter 3-like [Takifugu rubripes]|uniref:sodium- and chloride-dependent GABA transporter 3-like n=1 Tax=Takifugu rubripes TaxID=31033 RepID=UPI001145FD98|nr:sodium- and chloride-dependent GABA transporter 3-like [Takifugu rubripes]
MERREKEDQSSVGARGQWASKAEFILVVAGHAVGLGNLWRFPYLCYKNGGGAFLIPYCLLAVVFGVPLFLLETSLGQFTQEGFITCWRKVCPLAQGIGYAQLMVKLSGFNYIIIQAWSLFYLVFSFRAQLPWATCNNTWNTDNCGDLQNLDSLPNNVTGNESMQLNTTSAATEFWERRMLRMSGGIEELGSVSWELVLCLLACWVFCFFSIWKGVRSSGKVAYFTATFPYVMLLILLIRGATLPGAGEGIYYYLHPDLSRLAHFEVWIEAGSQIFFSYSLTQGTLSVLGSHSKYNNNCYKDCFWICLLNSCTSFVAGFVVFSVLGFMAHKQGVTVDTVADSGPGLAFIAYPQATALMPLPQFWTVCFFLMLFLLAVDSHFVDVESFITTVSDMFPKWFHKPLRQEIFVLVVCASAFLVHLLLITEGGIYIFQFFDYYGSSRICGNFIAVCECLALGWMFGADRVCTIIKDMTGNKPSVFFRLCWKYVIPPVSLTCFIVYLLDFKHLRIVPLWAVIQICMTPGTIRERFSVLCTPVKDPSWQKNDDGTTVELASAAVST